MRRTRASSDVSPRASTPPDVQCTPHFDTQVSLPRSREGSLAHNAVFISSPDVISTDQRISQNTAQESGHFYK